MAARQQVFPEGEIYNGSFNIFQSTGFHFRPQLQELEVKLPLQCPPPALRWLNQWLSTYELKAYSNVAPNLTKQLHMMFSTCNA